MEVINYANLKSSDIAAIEQELGHVRSFLDVFNWAKSQAPGILLPQVVQEVITQDEYTHDVIMPWRDGLVLVYDTT